MRHPSYFLIGRINKTHGLEGGLEASLDVQDPSRYLSEKTVYLEINGRLVPYGITAFQFKGGKAMLSLEDVNSLSEAAELAGSELFLPESLLPPLDETQFYLHELVGLLLVDDDLGELGSIEEIQERPGQPLAIIRLKNGREALVPAIRDLLYRISREEGKVYSRLPEGLIDLDE